MTAIAIIGMACRYPDARSPSELWETVLSQRRAFRALPPERLNAADYVSPDRTAPDRTYATEAALIDEFVFDRVRFRVSGSTYRSVDPAHWLALDVAYRALCDAGFVEGEDMPRATTGVVVGNTLTSEFARANVMRLRWPYVGRILDATLAEMGWQSAARREFLATIEARYKAPFVPSNEETLAGNLANTIAGRICNTFDFKGGGYTVDGACASSLLAVTTAATALATGEMDVALAGGVDLSLDPFELVGFAKTGALAAEEMRVYDRRSDGFWPGEGCGFVVMMRHADAVAQQRRIYALIRGWGISSDGHGGLTRPEVDGQSLALERAYRRAGFGIDTVSYFEGHGTGTRVGDSTELATLVRLRTAANPQARSAVIGSIKANIGHTKAAAGIAGLIKATLALQSQILPPMTGAEQPHAELARPDSPLRLSRGELWPVDWPLRAGVSAMGFGGINSHVVLEAEETARRAALTPHEEALIRSTQDAELFCLRARDAAGLLQQIDHLLNFAARLARSELTDLAAYLAAQPDVGALRAAVVAATPAALEDRLALLKGWVRRGKGPTLHPEAGVFLGAATPAEPVVGFLFSGQAAPVRLSGGAWGQRFAAVDQLYAQAKLPAVDDGSTATAQPAIVTASLAGLRVLSQLGLKAQVAIGHSLGELSALGWAGAIDTAALPQLAAQRGRIMASASAAPGKMASIQAAPEDVAGYLYDTPVVIAAYNTPLQTVIAGPADAVADIVSRAQAAGLRAVLLPVAHAFHSPLLAPAVPELADILAAEPYVRLQRTVISTVTGRALDPEADLRELLCRQVTAPVRFVEALQAAAPTVDLWIEVGPGTILKGLATECGAAPAVALNVGGDSLVGLLTAAGAAYALGAPVRPQALFAERVVRPFDWAWTPQFLANPCERAPNWTVDTQQDSVPPLPPTPLLGEEVERVPRTEDSARDGDTPLAVVQRLVASHTELPLDAMAAEVRLLSDLHLNSISAGQIVAEAARCLGRRPPLGLTDLADATLARVAEVLDEMPAATEETDTAPGGVAAWVRPFVVNWVAEPLPPSAAPAPVVDAGTWRVMAPPHDSLAETLATRLAQQPGSGVAVCLPPDLDETHVPLLVAATQVVLEQEIDGRFVLVQRGDGAAAWARSLHLEAPETNVCVINLAVDINDERAVDFIMAEVSGSHGFVEARYDAMGRRTVPVLTPVHMLPTAGDVPLGADDVLLVTGGGKGIMAECALALARHTGAALGIVGRTAADVDPMLQANLARLAAAGVRHRYIVADVTDATAVRTAVHEIQAAFGPITGVLHGAARNEPRRLAALDVDGVMATLAPKLQGLRNIWQALDPQQLRLLVSFGSVIARTGLWGQADYGLANEWLARLTAQLGRSQPHLRTLTVEWSVWAEVGMGTRLGRLDALVQGGVTPIPPERGIALLHELLAQTHLPEAVVVMGRFPALSTLAQARQELPFRRFLEQPRVHYPGVELVVDIELGRGSDPYLDDHTIDGTAVWPAVMALEAMAQVAGALMATAALPTFQAVSWGRPIAVGNDGTVIRIAALVIEPATVEIVVRSATTAFQVDHFRARCHFEEQAAGAPASESPVPARRDLAEPLLPLVPVRDLYGPLLFHQGRFRRVDGYRRLSAERCLAEIGARVPAVWFSPYLPGDLVLGDPAIRDAAIHAIQACIPHATVLPVGVEEIRPGVQPLGARRHVQAHERSRAADHFVYDVDILDETGQVVEQWTGLELQVVARPSRTEPWPMPMLAPYVARRMHDLTGVNLALGLVDDAVAARAERRSKLVQALFGVETVLHRADGRPELAVRHRLSSAAVEKQVGAISVAHTATCTMVVGGDSPLACDLEPVSPRPAGVWQNLLGPTRWQLATILADILKEDESAAATRVWSALECLKKAGEPLLSPLAVDRTTEDGWALLRTGSLLVATLVTAVQDQAEPLVLAILVDQAHVTDTSLRTRNGHARL